jgi:hypothetical protein
VKSELAADFWSFYLPRIPKSASTFTPAPRLLYVDASAILRCAGMSPGEISSTPPSVSTPANSQIRNQTVLAPGYNPSALTSLTRSLFSLHHPYFPSSSRIADRAPSFPRPALNGSAAPSRSFLIPVSSPMLIRQRDPSSESQLRPDRTERQVLL